MAQNVFGKIAVVCAPRETANLDASGDMASSVMEDGLVLHRALDKTDTAAQQIMLLRPTLKLLVARRAT